MIIIITKKSVISVRLKILSFNKLFLFLKSRFFSVGSKKYFLFINYKSFFFDFGIVCFDDCESPV